MSNVIKHCKNCNTTVMCHLERKCMRQARRPSAKERQKRMKDGGITEQELYKSRQAEKEAMQILS